MSRESVSIALSCAALNDLPICTCDIKNACPDFGLENTGKHAIIVRDLYGGKSFRADYWQHAISAIEEMELSSCIAEPGVYLRPVLTSNRVEHYQDFLLYTDDVLAIIEEPTLFFREELGKRSTLKAKSVDSPEQHLGEKFSQVKLENCVKCWSFSSSQHAQAALKNSEDYSSTSNLGPLLKTKPS